MKFNIIDIKTKKLDLKNMVKGLSISIKLEIYTCQIFNKKWMGTTLLIYGKFDLKEFKENVYILG